MMNSIQRGLVALVLTVHLGCRGGADEAITPDGHEHGGGEAVTLWTNAAELFFEYPPMVAGEPGEPWAIHLTKLDDFQPVKSGSLALHFRDAEGKEYTTVAEKPARDGIFTPAPSLPTPGSYELVMRLESPESFGGEHEIPVGSIRVYASETELPHVPEEEATGISFLKEQQWVIPFATAAAEQGEVRRGFEAHGEVVPAAGRYAEVMAPVDGLVRAKLNRNAPVPGMWVEAGAKLADLSPVGGESAFAAERARVERLEREVARARRLYEVEAIPQKRLEEAEHELAVTRSALESLGAAADSGYELVVSAPISGVVNDRRLAFGSRVSAGDLLFILVDPRTVWVRLNVPAAHAARASQVTGASLRMEGSDRVFQASRVVSVGSVIDPQKRTLPLVVEIPNSDRTLKIGMLAGARVLLGEGVQGVVVPHRAIRDEDGLKVAYLQEGGETFERRVLSVGPSDGEWTLVMSGIEEGERVVTEGAYQVRLASLNTSTLTDHGHPH
jgi:RND family efflux transporter MFP subunit